MTDLKVFHNFVFSEYEEEESFLNEMANKGYFFEKVISPGIYHFKKAEPKNIIYRIDFNPQKEKDRDSYLQMFRDYGWNHIQDLNEFSYFCKEEDGSDDDIFNDNQSRIEMLERIYNKKMIPLLVVLLCLIIPIVLRMIIGGHYTDTVSVVFYVIVIDYMLLCIIQAKRCMAGFNKLRKKYDMK